LRAVGADEAVVVGLIEGTGVAGGGCVTRGARDGTVDGLAAPAVEAVMTTIDTVRQNRCTAM
jgi:hypothetical protein